jgi:sterol desaturase/sphingolipid hydroxylase (fatty acid hydroxylase superfamily)
MSYVILAALLALLWTMESLAPMYAGRTRRLSHAGANLSVALINTRLLWLTAGALLRVTEAAGVAGIGLLNRVALPGWTEWLLAILMFDCWQYWWHRMNHRLPLLWRFHVMHHADAEMDVTTGLRFHPGELALSLLARLAVLPLLGLSLPQLALYESLAMPVILFQHSNLRLPAALDTSLRWLIVTPWMHSVHHSRVRIETDSNYSSLLSVWDRLFGSFRLRNQPAEISLGVDRFVEHEWRQLPGMLRIPFRMA